MKPIRGARETSRETNTPPEKTTFKKVVFTILTILLPLFVLCICGLVLLLINRDDTPADVPNTNAQPDDPIPLDPLEPGTGANGDPASLPPPVLDPAQQHQQALAAMKLRYRAGPFVRVLGMQPGANVQGGVMDWMSRRGRTLDNPWLVEGGALRRDRAPNARGGAAAPVIELHPAERRGSPITVVPRVPNRVRLQVRHPRGDDAIAGVHVAFTDYFGHFYIPADGEGADGEVGSIYITEPDVTAVTFGIDAAVLPNGHPIPGPNPHPVTMYIGVEDVNGNISSYATRQLQIVPVGTGDLEVTLTMTEATDLDLYVAEPTGVVIYYRNTNSFTGGQLDLDANAACNSNVGVNNEHIFWPRGRAPAGTYTVRVANYTSCINGGHVDYQVTVRNCGDVAVFAGGFDGFGRRDQCTSSQGQDPTWCHDAVSFVVTPCPAQ